MANVKIMVDGALMDGHRVTFKAPCDCVTVEKLKICYVKDGEQKSKLFTMKDSHGNDLTGLGNLFSKDTYVDAILDTNSGVAYLQNAATNKYLEQKFEPVGGLSSRVATLESDMGKVKPIQTVGSITYQVPAGNTELSFDKFGLTDTSYGMYLFCIRGGSSEYRFIGLLQISNAGAPSIDTIITKNVSASVVTTSLVVSDSKYAFKVTTNNSFNAIYSVVKIAG